LDPAVEDADLVAGGEDIGQHQHFLVADTLRHSMGRGVREGNTHMFGLGAVDLVSEDPTPATGALAVPAFPAEATAAARADARH
jgi:hypothetical protein